MRAASLLAALLALLASLPPRALAALLSPGHAVQRSQAGGDSAQARFAVVRPFWSGELSEVAPALTGDLPAACRGAGLPVDLVLYYAGSPTDTIRSQNGSHTALSVGQSLTALAKDPATGKCFQNVRVEYARLMPGIVYPVAPCLQFTHIFATTPKAAWGYEAFFQMELDVRPLRSGWLEDMLPVLERAATGDAWVIGGFYDTGCLVDAQGHNPSLPKLPADDPRVDKHPNGNAVYTSTNAYSMQVRNQDAKCRMGGLTSHYDFYMFEDWRERWHPKQLANKWVTDPFFKNCKPTPTEKASGIRTMPPADIAKRFPRALLAHCRK